MEEERLNLNRYRIKKSYIIDRYSNIDEIYIPQYKSKLFGWLLFTEQHNFLNIFGINFFVFMFGMLGAVSVILGIVFMTNNDFLLGSLSIGIPFLILLFILYSVYKKPTKWVYGDDGLSYRWFSSLDSAKNFIETYVKEEEKRLNAILKKKGLEEEVYFMSLKVERYHKLKKLKRKIRL